MRFTLNKLFLIASLVFNSGCTKTTIELAKDALADTTLRKVITTREGTFNLKLLPPVSLLYLANAQLHSGQGADKLLHAYRYQLGMQIEGNLDSTKTKWVVKELKQNLNFHFMNNLSAFTTDSDTLMPGFTHCEYSSNNGGSFRILAYFEADSLTRYNYQFNLITPVLRDTLKIIYSTASIKKYI